MMSSESNETTRWLLITLLLLLAGTSTALLELLANQVAGQIGLIVVALVVLPTWALVIKLA